MRHLDTEAGGPVRHVVEGAMREGDAAVHGHRVTRFGLAAAAAPGRSRLAGPLARTRYDERCPDVAREYHPRARGARGHELHVVGARDGCRKAEAIDAVARTAVVVQ